MNFDAVPQDKGTKIVLERKIIVESLEALHQVWVWDGIIGESLIFRKTDVDGFDENRLKEILEMTGLHTRQEAVTFNASGEDFRFVNFNFREQD